MLSDNERQFRSSVQNHPSAANHYTFGTSSYYFNNPRSSSNLQNFQQNVNMTLNHDRSTISENSGFVNMIHPVPLTLSAVEATLNHHLCRGRPNQNQNQTLMVPRSCGKDHVVDSNTWGTQNYNRRDKKASGYQNFDEDSNDKNYIHNRNSQLNSLYQDVETCRYNPECRQDLKNGLSSHTNNGNILTGSSDQPFLFGQENIIPPPRHLMTSNDPSPYAVPGEHHTIQPPLSVLHPNRQTCFHQQNGRKIHENHYQNIQSSNTGCGKVINSYSNHSSIDHLNNRGDVDNGNANDIWLRDTHVESPR